jgi:hypothetical protein
MLPELLEIPLDWNHNAPAVPYPNTAKSYDNNFDAYSAENHTTDEVRKELSFSLNQLLN